MRASATLILAVLGFPGVAAAASLTLPTDGSWHTFGRTKEGTTGPIQFVDGDKSLDSFEAGRKKGYSRIDIVDCCIIGTRYTVTIDGGSGQTADTFMPSVDTSDIKPADNASDSGHGLEDPGGAWSDPRLSKASFYLFGTHHLDIEVIRTGGASDQAMGNIRAVLATPIPATLSLMGSALVALGFLRRKRSN